MPEEPTHVLMVYKSQDSEILARADTGVVIAQRKGATIIFGPEPNKRRSHVFLTPEYAFRYLSIIATEDLRSCPRCAGIGQITLGVPCPICHGTGHRAKHDGPREAVVEHRDGEPLLVMPADAMELPGGIRGLN